jgi:hypothetical protein
MSQMRTGHQLAVAKRVPSAERLIEWIGAA